MSFETLIEIDYEEYEELKRDQKVLRALEDGGVNNWEWFEASLEDLDLD